jgi:hypothetical protein
LVKYGRASPRRITDQCYILEAYGEIYRLR